MPPTRVKLPANVAVPGRVRKVRPLSGYLEMVEGALRRWRLRLLAGVGGGVLVATIVGLVLSYPSVAAVTCPGCYGMIRIDKNVYVEPGMSAKQAHRLSAALDVGSERVSAFYGGHTSSPRILACTTDSCYRRIGGGHARGIAVLNRSVMLSPRGLNATIAAHEMSHVELHRRLGMSATGKVPQWFDEGLAVVVADDRRYLLSAKHYGGADRCRVKARSELPVSLEDWFNAASTDDEIYGKAACRVSRWLAANGGRQGLLQLIEQLRAGKDFPELRP